MYYRKSPSLCSIIETSPLLGKILLYLIEKAVPVIQTMVMGTGMNEEHGGSVDKVDFRNKITDF
jgi:hypothetical protein